MGSRDVAGDLRGRLHDEIPQGTSDRHIVCSQRDAHPFLGVVIVVDGVVSPPSAVVVPDMVVRVVEVVVFHAPTSSEGVGQPLS